MSEERNVLLNHTTKTQIHQIKTSDKHREQSTMLEKLYNEKIFANYQFHLERCWYTEQRNLIPTNWRTSFPSGQYVERDTKRRDTKKWPPPPSTRCASWFCQHDTTQTETFLERWDLSWKSAFMRLVCRQICRTYMGSCYCPHCHQKEKETETGEKEKSKLYL